MLWAETFCETSAKSLAENFATETAGEFSRGPGARVFRAKNLIYGATLRLCTPAAIENPDPAACGSHHMRRTQRFWLTIMRLPI